MTLGVLFSALEFGLIYALIALSLFISFTILNICDLSTDGCYMLGAAVGVSFTIMGHPLLAILAAMLAGVASGFVCAILQTKLGVPSILAGIVVNTGLYTVNLCVMGLKTQLNLVNKDTVFSLFGGISESAFWQESYKLILLIIIVALVGTLIYLFLGTGLGLSIRATGDSPAMVRASSIDPSFTITVGLMISGSLTGLAGCLAGQYSKTAEINMGTGMVTIALASLIIGSTIFGRGKMPVKIFGAVMGSVIYRIIIAIALRLRVPTQAFKLVSAIIVAVAIAAPKVSEIYAMNKRKKAAMARRGK